MAGMEPVAIVTVLILLQFFWFAILVGKARVKNKIEAPAVTGNEEFERAFRVHQNTEEQLIVVLPTLWLFGWYIDPLIASFCGLVFMLGRWLYCSGYLEDPSTRGKGFIVGQLAQTVLLLGALVGPILAYFS